jgi:3-oxoacyl-[acyl-carrier protein] reductase
MAKLTDKVAIITGGAQGIGKAAVQRFAEEGAIVVIWDIDEQKTSAFITQLIGQGWLADATEVDITSLASTAAAAKTIFERYGRIDILVNNAGITRDASLLKMSTEHFDEVIDVNLKGAFNCTKAVTPYMIEQAHGRIINTSSVVGVYGNFGQTNYAASKAGLIGMTKVWARELGRKGITVNAVAPGYIATGMTAEIPQHLLSQAKERIPVGRMGTPEDVAHAYVFLASDEAAFVNGAVLHVDGGMVA